jgi:class 3 adenylate cyclase/tetratricopeptide (TPR) repeat protein
MSEIENLERGIAALETQRAVLGDAVVDAMLAAIRQRLAVLMAQAAHGAIIVQEQRKQVTVLFADVSGFTAMSEALDAEDVRDRMNILWAQLDKAIQAHGGMIDKHIGDAVMALWGVDAVREDDPLQAIRAAMVMQAELDAYRAQTGSGLAIRIGLNTGPVMLGAVGSTGEFTAIGDTVNLASRLEESAPVGGILISHDTYRHVRGVFDVQAQPPLVVKGKAEPVQTYLVLRAKPRTFRVRRRGVEGVETRMVGRARELQQIQAALHTVLDQHAMQVITIVGEPGLGKSRLLYEFQNWLELQPERMQTLKGRATEEMRSLPYALLRNVFADRFEIADSDPLAQAQTKLERGVVEMMAGDADAQMKAHFIGHLIGIDFTTSDHLRGILEDPRQIRSRAYHYLTQFFAALDLPGILILDDLHWADDGSLDALNYLKRTGLKLPLLILALARPSLFERPAGWKTDQGIDLHPLSDLESRQLVDEILQKVPEVPLSLYELLLSGAEGNPYYLEELVKMLVDQRVILPGDRQWQVQPERLGILRVPPTLTAVLQARLDSLTMEEREVLQRASVVGRIFWDGAVRALSDDPLSTLPAILQALQTGELVFVRDVSAFTGADEYIFKHAILRDVTYETVLLRLRKTYHARAAAWLIEHSGERADEYLPLVAEHYEKADDRSKAAQAFARAGERALAVSAFTDAAIFFQRALGLASGNSVWYRKLGEARYNLGDFPAAQQAMDEALAVAGSDAERAAALTKKLGILWRLTGDTSRVSEFAADVLPLARASSDPATLAEALLLSGGIYLWQGNLDQARACFEESLPLTRLLGAVTFELRALHRLGWVSASSGDLAEAELLYQEVYQRATALGDRYLAMAALGNLAEVMNTHRDLPRAQAYDQQYLVLAREIGAQDNIALGLINLADKDIQLGQLFAARAELREGLALACQLGVIPNILVGVLIHAYLAHAEGQTERALALLGMLQRHSAWDREFQRVMDEELARWNLDPQVVQVGLARGIQLDFDAIIKTLMEG